MKGLEDFISRTRKTLLLRYKNSSKDTSDSPGQEP